MFLQGMADRDSFCLSESTASCWGLGRLSVQSPRIFESTALSFEGCLHFPLPRGSKYPRKEYLAQNIVVVPHTETQSPCYLGTWTLQAKAQTLVPESQTLAPTAPEVRHVALKECSVPRTERRPFVLPMRSPSRHIAMRAQLQ